MEILKHLREIAASVPKIDLRLRKMFDRLVTNWIRRVLISLDELVEVFISRVRAYVYIKNTNF